jgi:hypothetical protein
MPKKLYVLCIELYDFMPFAKLEPDDSCPEYLSQYINPAIPLRRKKNKLSVFFGAQGSGKSAFVASLLWALYGELPENHNNSVLCYDAIKRCDGGKANSGEGKC